MTAAQPGAYRDIAEIKLNYPLLEVVERAGVRLGRVGGKDCVRSMKTTIPVSSSTSRTSGSCASAVSREVTFWTSSECMSISTPSVRRAPGSQERLCHRPGSEPPTPL